MDRPRRLLALSLVSLFLTASLLSAATGTAAAASTGWAVDPTDGTRILNPAGTQFIITGINWYGFETRGYVAHGLYSQDYTFILEQIKQYGYNTVRIPFSNEMWEKNPIPKRNLVSACPACKGTHARDILGLIINYAGSIGLHVILDNHRSEAGNSAQANGLWYTSAYPEQVWISDWRSVQRWVHGQKVSTADTVVVNYLASDGFPTVLGYDLRNEPHTPARTPYLQGATWGTGDGIDPRVNPNPNPFAPACVASSTCHDWRLAAERVGDTLLGDAKASNWDYPLLFVEGVSTYPTSTGTAANGPYDWYWWGGNLLGINGNANNPGAPVVLNAGRDATRSTGLGDAVPNQLVYSAHDYGPSTYKQRWFNTNTCYKSGCSPSSLADVWGTAWAFTTLAGGVSPVWMGQSYPWGNTGSSAYTQAPMYLGEFGTGKSDSDLYSSGAGSQGQWFTDLVNFLQSSYERTASNDSGIPVRFLNWTYWALNGEDNAGLLTSNYASLANPRKEYSFLCFDQQGSLAIPRGSQPGQCGSTGPLPNPQ